MIELSLHRLFEGLAGTLPRENPAVKGLCLDSRKLKPGDVFVALAGASGHGMQFVQQACEHGAVAIVHDGRMAAPSDSGLPVVQMPDLAEQLPELARRCWGERIEMLDLVAVTGTNGKSSVAWLLAQALDGAMIGTLGWGRPGQLRAASLTTPDIFSVYRQLSELAAQGMGSVVLEASSHALDQGRLGGLNFTATILTSLGHDHLDYHADLAAYAAAKARLFTHCQSERQLINFDDEFGRFLAEQLAESEARSGRLIGYTLSTGNGTGARARAELLRADVSGIEAGFELGDARFIARSRLVGRLNLWNLLIVAAELHERGYDGAAITQKLAVLEPVPGRMEPLGRPGYPLALIDYAHTPDALDNALMSARELAEGSLWCVFGCGGDRDRGKRPKMGRLAERLADQIVLTDDNPRNEDGLAIIRDIQAGMARPQHSTVIRDRARAIAHALGQGQAGDVVLVAGKGHETEQVIGDKHLPCDDHDSVRQALGVAA